MPGVGDGFWKDGPLWRQKLGLPKKARKKKAKRAIIHKDRAARRRRLELKRLDGLAARHVDLAPRIKKRTHESTSEDRADDSGRG